MDNSAIKNKNVHNYENRLGLAADLSGILNNPELYDVIFLVGKHKRRIGGIKALLAARSR